MIDEDACLGSTLIKYQINSLMNRGGLVMLCED